MALGPFDASKQFAKDAAEQDLVYYGGSKQAYQRYIDENRGNAGAYRMRGANDYLNSQNARGQQADLATYFAQQAMGQGGPSVAQKQLQAGLDQATNNAMGIAASSRTNPAAAARAAIQAQGQMAAQTNQQAGILRAQEQLDAGNLAMQAGQGLRQQDLGSYGQNLGQEMNYQNTLHSIESNQQAERSGMFQNMYGTTLSAKIGKSIAAAQNRTQMMGAAMSGIGTASASMAASDKRLKKNVHDGDLLAQAFMDSLDAKGFEYKGDNVPQLGIMAQDMERTREGRSAVLDTPNGKAVSVPDATSRLLAAVANLNKRTKELEGKKGGR